MTTHSNYSLQNFSTNNARVLTGISQPVSEIKLSLHLPDLGMDYRKVTRTLSTCNVVERLGQYIKEANLIFFFTVLI